MQKLQDHYALATLLLCLGLTYSSPAFAQTPWRLDAALGAPEWFKIEGEARARYESLSGQFRAGGTGGDQALAFRTLVLAELDAGPVAAGLELQDSRVLLDDSGSPLTSNIVNPIDVLQAFVRIDGARSALKVGRQTLDFGSRRIFERVEMANVIFAYTGAYAQHHESDGDEWHALAVVPVARLPDDRDALGEDKPTGDEEEWGQRFYGLHWRNKDAFGQTLPDTWLELFYYRLDERDTRKTASSDRKYHQPGLRLFRAPKEGVSDFDIEAAWRFGTRRASIDANDTRIFDVSAWMLHAHWGYTFQDAWNTRIAFDYDYASGDKDPNDDRFGQHERLSGGRRTDFGNTGIHGPLTPSNISAPGARIEIAPHPRFDARLSYKAAFLAQSRDAWSIARVRDSAGRSGDFIGHSFDLRTRTWIVPQNLRLEIGGSLLTEGDFARNAPNAARNGDTFFAYFELKQTF